MEPAFWDSSSLVPLCIWQPSTLSAKALSKQYGMFVWWAAPVEIRRFPLKAADALQLAAGLAWTSGRPRSRAFISGDTQLLEAAGQLGFLPLKA